MSNYFSKYDGHFLLLLVGAF